MRIIMRVAAGMNDSRLEGRPIPHVHEGKEFDGQMSVAHVMEDAMAVDDRVELSQEQLTCRDVHGLVTGSDGHERLRAIV